MRLKMIDRGNPAHSHTMIPVICGLPPSQWKEWRCIGCAHRQLEVHEDPAPPTGDWMQFANSLLKEK